MSKNKSDWWVGHIIGIDDVSISILLKRDFCLDKWLILPTVNLCDSHKELIQEGQCVKWDLNNCNIKFMSPESKEKIIWI